MHTQQTNLLDLVTDTHRTDAGQLTIGDALEAGVTLPDPAHPGVTWTCLRNATTLPTILAARAKDDAAREAAADQARRDTEERNLSRSDVEW